MFWQEVGVNPSSQHKKTLGWLLKEPIAMFRYARRTERISSGPSAPDEAEGEAFLNRFDGKTFNGIEDSSISDQMWPRARGEVVMSDTYQTI